MKKNYFAPNMEVVEFQLCTIIAGSPDYTHQEEAGEGSQGGGINFSSMFGGESSSDEEW